MKARTAVGVACQSASEIPAGVALITGGLCLRCNRESSRRQGFSRDEVRSVPSRPLNRYVDPKRKSLGYGTYVIQDYIKGVAPSSYSYPNFDARKQTLQCFFNQLTILHAVGERIDSVLSNIEGELLAEIQDGEIAVARQLSKVSLRAAGALAGVVIEGHLQKVADAHGLKIAKKNPTIADLNDPLKAASVIDTPAWRKISFLADICNLCAHKKDAEPTKQQVEGLIQGAEWLTKNVF